MQGNWNCKQTEVPAGANDPHSKAITLISNSPEYWGEQCLKIYLIKPMCSTTSLRILSRSLLILWWNEIISLWKWAVKRGSLSVTQTISEWTWVKNLRCWQGEIESLAENPIHVLLCPQKIPYGLIWTRTRVSTVRNQWPTVLNQSKRTGPVFVLVKHLNRD